MHYLGQSPPLQMSQTEPQTPSLVTLLTIGRIKDDSNQSRRCSPGVHRSETGFLADSSPFQLCEPVFAVTIGDPPYSPVTSNCTSRSTARRELDVDVTIFILTMKSNNRRNVLVKSINFRDRGYVNTSFTRRFSAFCRCSPTVLAAQPSTSAISSWLVSLGRS